MKRWAGLRQAHIFVWGPVHIGDVPAGGDATVERDQQALRLSVL